MSLAAYNEAKPTLLHVAELLAAVGVDRNTGAAFEVVDGHGGLVGHHEAARHAIGNAIGLHCVEVVDLWRAIRSACAQRSERQPQVDLFPHGESSNVLRRI